jgi:hypothetical protein
MANTSALLDAPVEQRLIAGYRGDPRWWAGDMVELLDNTCRVRDLAGRWVPCRLDGTSRYPSVMTDSEVSAALHRHYSWSIQLRWQVVAEEQAAELAELRARIR